MSYVEKQSIHTVTESASVWELPLPTTAIAGSATVDVVQDANGSQITVDSQIQTQVPSLLISFGLDEHAGTARYSWLEEAGSSVVTDNAGNVVNITVTQNGGTAPTGATF